AIRSIDFKRLEVYEAGALLVTLLAYPGEGEHEEERRSRVHTSLCACTLRAIYELDPDRAASPQLIKPIYAFQTERDCSLGLRTLPRRLRHRIARESGEEGGALHRAQPCSDADRTEIADDRFSGGEVWRHGMEIAGVEPVRIPSLREQLLRLHRIVWVGIYRQRKWHAFPHDVAVDLGGAERIGVAERLS